MGWITRLAVFTSCFLICCSLAICAGCSKAKALPADWPLPQLTLPPQSVITEIKLLPAQAGQKVWRVYFNTPLAPAQVTEDVRSKLGPLGYLRRSKTDEPGFLVSPDTKTQIFYLKIEKGAHAGMYTIQLFVSAEPLPPEQLQGTSPL